jgi:phage tail-like protein
MQLMDANHTHFHLLLGRDDWARCTTETRSPIFDTTAASPFPFSWDIPRSELTLGARINVFHSSPENRPPSIDQRRGAGQDRFGNWYWIADSRAEILVSSTGTGVTTHFWASTDETLRTRRGNGGFSACQIQATEAPLAFGGLTVTSEHYLVVGVVDPAGLVIFDLFHGGPPVRLVWPSKVPFVPFDMAPAPRGGVWVLDRVNRRLWALDRAFGVIRQDQPDIDLSAGQRDDFSAIDGNQARARPALTFPTGISLESASPLRSIDAIGVAALPDGSVLLLESRPTNGFSLIYRFKNGSQIGNPASLAGVLDLLEPEDQLGFTLLGFDFAFMALEQTPRGPRQNTLYVVGQNGDQSWAFDTNYDTDQLVLSPLREYYPMRRFGGRGLVAGQDHVHYDAQDRWIALIVQKRPRYVEDAILLTPVIDGKQPDCVWHKVMLDASIPPDTKLTIRTRAHNEPAFLELQPWVEEPKPYQRGNGSELPWVSMSAGLGTWELLFQRATGQYLQLELTFSGNGKITPRVRALRVYYPRFSYLDHYLPGVYRENEASASFLDRFLANFEGFYTSIEDRVATVQALFDVGSAPSDALDWLANWFGVALDPVWTEAKRRLFLQNAATFFEARGTVPGLAMALRLALEDCVDPGIFTTPVTERMGLRLVEGFQTRQLPSGLLQDPLFESGLPIKTQTAVWTPSQGAEELHRRYRESLQSTVVMYPIYLPLTDAQYKQWISFSMKNLGLVPDRPDGRGDLWPTFLRCRYSSIGALNLAYRSTFTAFSDVPFPTELPRQSQPLQDWYQFQGVLAIQAAAHQFTVFLPMVPGDARNVEAHRNKVSLARRVIDLEKPAHTAYEIKFYWAFFRVGEARLGKDSVLDYGSRAPQLLQPVLLGDTYLGSAYLSRNPPTRPFLEGSC